MAYSDDIGHVLGREVEPEVSEAVKRRAYLAAVSGLLFGETSLGGAILGEAAPLAWERLVVVTSTPLPTKIGTTDVAALRAVTEEMRALGRTGHAGMPEVLAPVSRRADQLLTVAEVNSAETFKALRSALAALHELTGWCAYDMHLLDLARWHFDRALKLARDADDVMAMVSTVYHAAVGYRELGDPNDALKMYQMALMRLDGVKRPGVLDQRLKLHVVSARALAQLDCPDHVNRELTQARALPDLADQFETADIDDTYAGIELAAGRIDVAEQYATKSLRTWGPEDRRDSASARVQLATINAVAGEPKTERLALQAIDAVAGLRSVRGRALLLPLEQALAARKTSTFMDLAERVRSLRTAGGARP